MRLACWALTRSMLILRGVLNASFTACLVISLKTTRQSWVSSSSRACARCQAIASPSRSGSAARYTFLTFLLASLSSFNTEPFPRMVMYLGLKPFSTSTPIWLLGRSRTCPIDAFTIYLLPKYLPIVFALAGDSTMTNESATESSS
ncbi:hypothetical protein D3C71_1807680 [compost metagenome]